MPIEIKELHIRINLNERKGAHTETNSPQDIKIAVEESMNRILEMVKNKKER